MVLILMSRNHQVLPLMRHSSARIIEAQIMDERCSGGIVAQGGSYATSLRSAKAKTARKVTMIANQSELTISQTKNGTKSIHITSIISTACAYG